MQDGDYRDTVKLARGSSRRVRGVGTGSSIRVTQLSSGEQMVRSTTSDESVTGSAALAKSGTTARRRSLAECPDGVREHGQALNASCPSERTDAVLNLARGQREIKVSRRLSGS